MAHVRRTESFNDYYTFNIGALKKEPLQNFFILETIKRVIKGEEHPMKGFNIIDEGGLNTTVLMVEDFCLIYGVGYSDEIISLLSSELEFQKFKRFTFAGSKKIIDRLFKYNNATYQIEKDRLIYKCSKVTEDFEYAPGEMQMGDMTRLKELVNLSRAFVKAWDGKERSIEAQKRDVASGIMHRNFYQWVYKSNICAIAQAMQEEHDFPVIGHLFTNPAFRKQGFASSIVHRLTQDLLEAENEFYMLVADANNPASNKVFINVGYEKVGDYFRVWKPK